MGVEQQSHVAFTADASELATVGPFHSPILLPPLGPICMPISTLVLEIELAKYFMISVYLRMLHDKPLAIDVIYRGQVPP